MDYPFENLDPETFQQFCQALLLRSFSDLQCFPVAQPDGGRDAVSYIHIEGALDFAMFQVKFVRKPLAVGDPHAWLLDVIRSEAPKVAQQIPKGAKQFVLLTNVPGTGHPASGSIDQAHALLSSALSIPAQVWWRDDLSRRLDDAWDIKWAYPQLFTGPDLLRALVETALTEQRERRVSALQSFLADQFALDEEVKFKQVELQNRLLDLFIDVPLSPLTPPTRRQFSHHNLFAFVARKAHARQIQSLVDEEEGDFNWRHARYSGSQEMQVGAASFLLDETIQERLSKVVLEGAPGQGKSTITQYVAQVHRMRLLGKRAELQTVAVPHQSAPVRLPFKVDLRDLASWLSKRDPFSSEEQPGSPQGWRRSLESFLAALVRHHSGGAQFDVSDLLAVFKRSAVLLVFDGLDEVAEIARRHEVVEEIVRGTRRLEENSASLQVIVTSRPAAFANSPGLPEDQFPYFHLNAVTRPLIDAYAERWMRARKLGGRERADVKRILKEKLDQPHLRDLARNPMQLAILLSLIHRRGSSLPDKRTALYDAYVELFFSREAEKSSVVRDHRDLLIDIHRFIAWTLHADAQQKGSTGSIRTDNPEKLVAAYLASEGYDPSLAGALFHGMVERVVALVSRVEGTFEFEVQPLREYFAASFLYETAPYSPPGNEQRGTKPDRFDALARDFYWLNVTRFYAGCFSKGELPALVDRLQELVRDVGYARLAHPRLLATTLLSDWVFAQHQKSVGNVVNLVLDGIGLRFLVSSSRRRIHSSSPVVLPSRSGREELVSRCLELLDSNPPRDYRYDVSDVLQANATPDELLALWLNRCTEASGDERTRWLSFGGRLGTLSRISFETMVSLLADGPLTDRRIRALQNARRWDYLEATAETFRHSTEVLLSGHREVPLRSRSPQSTLERFAQSVAPTRYAIALHIPEPLPLNEVWARQGFYGELSAAAIASRPIYQQALFCEEVSDAAERESHRLARVWATELSPWENVTEAIRSRFGEGPIVFQLANYSAGIRSTSETCREFSSLFDRDASICRRARYARLRSGNAAWWKRQLGLVSDANERLFFAILFFSWASSSTLATLVGEVGELIGDGDTAFWRLVLRAIGGVPRGRNSTSLVFDVASLPALSERVVVALAARCAHESRVRLFERFLFTYKGRDPLVLELSQKMALLRLADERADHKELLSLISRSYQAGVVSDDYALPRAERGTALGWPAAVSEAIMDRPNDFPAFVVAIAERICHARIASRVRPVGQVARDEKWFLPTLDAS